MDRPPGQGPPRPRALLFDFDGLLCDTEAAGHRAWRELYAEHGLEFPEHLWRSMVGREDGERLAVRGLVGDDATDVDVAGLLVRRRRRKRELCAAEPLRPGARSLLAAAADADVATAVVSSGRSAWVVPHLERLGVRRLFAAIVTGDQVRRPKPDPEPYLLALHRLGRGAHETVAFEDSPVGVRAARAAGVWCVAVDNAAGGPADLSGADAVLHTLADYRLPARSADAGAATTGRPSGHGGQGTTEGVTV